MGIRKFFQGAAVSENVGTAGITTMPPPWVLLLISFNDV